MKDTKGKKGAPTVVKSIVKDKTRKIEEKDIKKRKGAVKEAKAKKPRASKKAAKAAKDPNAPKRPPTAFFLFLNEFRKTFKEEHPDVKGVTMVSCQPCSYIF
jgi:high mobility group protein B1